MKGKLRNAAEKIYEALGDTKVAMTFGRREASQHTKTPVVKFIPVGGTVSKAARTAGKTIPGSAGMIEPGPNASLNQPNVDKRVVECALRQPRMLVFCEAGAGKGERDAIDETEALLERVVVAAFAAFADEVTLESERWIVQEEERAGLGLKGEAVALTLAFQFPVIREEKPLIRLGGFTLICKLGQTLEND